MAHSVMSSEMRHQRRHSWPPAPLRKVRSRRADIDENPFAYFISAANEPTSYLFDNVHVDVDIKPTSPNVETRRRSLPKLKHPLKRWISRAMSQKAVAKIKQWFKHVEKLCHRNKPTEHVKILAPEPIVMVEQVYVVEQQAQHDPSPRCSPDLEADSEPERFCLRQPIIFRARSHSARPRSWMEPRADLWTVFEENPEDERRSRSISVIPSRCPYPT